MTESVWDNGASGLLTIFDQGIVGFARMSLNGHLIRVNARFCEMSGMPRETLLGRSFPDIAVVEDRPSAQGALDQLLAGGSPRTIEQRYQRTDGGIVWTTTAITLIRDADGKPVQFVVLAQDITKLKRAENQLRESQENLLLALEGAQLGVWHWSILANRWWASDACRAYLGIPPGTPVNRETLLASVCAEDREHVAKALARSLATLGHYEEEFRVNWPDGSEHWLTACGRTFGLPDGTPDRMEGVVGDITQRKANEQALRDLTARLESKVTERTAQLVAASAAKSIFVANMSHEIRTPLNAILGLAQVLEQAAPAGSEQRDLSERIRDAGTVLLRTLNDVLDLSKIEAGQLQIERQPFHAARLVENVESLTRSMAAAKGIGLRIDAADCASLYLDGDRVRAEQVLLNLLSNAIKFTAQGDIILSARVVARGAGTVRLRFEVRDQGIGIAAGKLAALFAPFTQADSSIARRYGGTGLGLAISKRLVELMGGVIGVDSVEGAGSTFWFEMPFDLAIGPVEQIRGESPGAPSGAAAAGGLLRGLRILVVDDSRMNLDVAERLLKRDGAVVTPVDDGQQALEILRARPGDFDVVLMDIQMPVLDGLSATRKIRQDPKLARLPVIALTAGVMTEEREAARTAGVDDFLPKPLDLKQMRGMLARYCKPALVEV